MVYGKGEETKINQATEKKGFRIANKTTKKK